MKESTRETLFIGGVFGAAASVALSGIKVFKFGEEIESVALSATGAIMVTVGGMVTAFGGVITLMAPGDGKVSPLAGIALGGVVTLGAFEAAGNPIIEFGDVRSPKVEAVVPDAALSLEPK